MPDDLDILLRQLKDLKAQRDSGALAEELYQEQVAKVLAGEQLPQPVTPSRARAASFLVMAPLGNAANSFAGEPAPRPSSPLEQALEKARKTDLPLTQRPPAGEPGPSAPVGTAPPAADLQGHPAQRRDSYWDRSSRVLRPLPVLAEDLGGPARPGAGYWSRAQRA